MEKFDNVWFFNPVVITESTFDDQRIRSTSTKLPEQSLYPNRSQLDKGIDFWAPWVENCRVPGFVSFQTLAGGTSGTTPALGSCEFVGLDASLLGFLVLKLIVPMNVILISSDNELRTLCGDVLSTFAAHGCQLTTATTDNCPVDADFYIWDSPAGMKVPPGIDRPAKHLFLVNRADIGTLSQGLGIAEANILLKPVTQASLSAFLGMAVAAFQERIGTTTSLRADRDEVLQCLIQSNLKLQEYDQDRTNFLARAVHDFRAPLTATCGYCGLLLSEALGPLNEDQQEVLRRMQHSVKRLSQMSSAMFELSVGRHVKRKPDIREADIRECIEQALHETNPFAEGKRISISVDLEPPPVPLYIEPGQIEQVVVNLLDNACKFTPRGGEIEIRGYPSFRERRSLRQTSLQEGERRQRNSRAPNSYRIDIRDSGPQIPWEHLNQIFEEYTSYSGGQDRSGGGLGLAICRMIITMHEGKVWGENTDRGPQFSFVIPLIPTGAVKTAAAAKAALSH